MANESIKLFSDLSDCGKPFDAVVVGSGLTGGWAAKELSEAGLEVLLLDAGPLLSPTVMKASSWLGQERRRSASVRQPTQSRHSAYWTSNPQLFVDDLENPYRSSCDFVWIRGRQVGGRSLTWAGVMRRFSDHEFLAPERDGFGVGWPICFRDLEPYYERVERFLDPNSGEFPDCSSDPPLSELEGRFKSIVESNWPDRRVGRCQTMPARASGGPNESWPPKTNLHSTIPAAFATGRTTLRPDSIVSHLVTTPDGSAIQSVSCLDRITKRPFQVVGKAVLLCASAIETVRIMLNSTCRHHPQGIGNSYGLLGRYLVDHIGVTVAGTVPDSEQMAIHPTADAIAFLIPNFRNVRSPHGRFIRGYGIRAGVRRGGIPKRGQTAQGSGDVSWVQTAFLEVLPRESNRVSVDGGHCDAFGIPSVRIHLSYGENERHMKADAIRCMLEMSEAADFDVELVQVTAPGRTAHELGGARMGNERASSVIDPWNRCWDVPNLFVLDGACFVTSGWQDPALTMMAIAVRACAGIVKSFEGQPGPHLPRGGPTGKPWS